MQGWKHYLTAERLLSRATLDDSGTIYEANASPILAAAQVHATLAQAAAIAGAAEGVGIFFEGYGDAIPPRPEPAPAAEPAEVYLSFAAWIVVHARRMAANLRGICRAEDAEAWDDLADRAADLRQGSPATEEPEATEEPGPGAIVEVAGRRIAHTSDADAAAWRVLTGASIPIGRGQTMWPGWEELRALGPVRLLLPAADGGQ